MVAPMAMGRKRTSKDVKRERQKTEKQITQTRKKITQTDLETGRQLDRLNLLNAQMDLRGDSIHALQARLDSVDGAIHALSDSIEALSARQTALKGNYAKTLRKMRSRRQGMSDLAFVFSAESFSQAWRRIRYLREVAKTSQRQSRQIAQNTARLEDARSELDTLRAGQAASLASLNHTQATQKKEKDKADRLVADLRKQSKSLNRELERRNKQAQDLDKELDRIIEQEIAAARERERREAEAKRQAEEKARKEAEAKRLAEEKARKEAEAKRLAEEKAAAEKAVAEKSKKPSKQPSKTPTPAPSTPAKPSQAPKPEPKPTPAPKPEPKPAESKKAAAKEAFASEAERDRRLTGSFEQNKGKLLFPVAGKYTVTSKFGTYDHPDLAKIKITNLGIDIEVPKGTQTRSVFDGVVTSIFRTDGYHNVVIVRHGEYLTVYAGIEALAVKKGDQVKTGQKLGTIFSDPNADGRTKLHFELRHEKQKLNPSEWVR